MNVILSRYADCLVQGGKRLFSIRMTQPCDAVLLPAIEESADRAFLVVPQLSWVATSGVFSAESHVSFICNHYSIVAVDYNDIPTGFLVARKSEASMHIYGLAVREALQGQGIGRSLLEQVIRDARNDGMVSITLTTFRDLSWNQYFYQSAGFHVIPDTQLTPYLADLLTEETHHGFLRETRCAMQMPLMQPTRLPDEYGGL